MFWLSAIRNTTPCEITKALMSTRGVSLIKCLSVSLSATPQSNLDIYHCYFVRLDYMQHYGARRETRRILPPRSRGRAGARSHCRYSQTRRRASSATGEDHRGVRVEPPGAGSRHRQPGANRAYSAGSSGRSVCGFPLRPLGRRRRLAIFFARWNRRILAARVFAATGGSGASSPRAGRRRSADAGGSPGMARRPPSGPPSPDCAR